MKPNRAVTMPHGGRLKNRTRRPFWLPAANYYILAVFATIVLSLIVWAVMNEGDDENSFLIALTAGVSVFLSAVFLREIVLRKAANRLLETQKQLDSQIEKVFSQTKNNQIQKITLEQNSAIVKEIKTKSDAAKILGHLPETHREIFEICNRYLAVSKIQIINAGAGSPRVAAFRKSREYVKQLHRFHLLEWVQGETKILTQEAKIRVTIDEQIRSVQKAQNLIVRALNFYPNESRLTDSEYALKEFVSTLKISNRLEEAEKAAFRGDYETASGYYQDALLILEKVEIQKTEKEFIAARIIGALEKIPQKEKQKKTTFSAVPQDLEDIL